MIEFCWIPSHSGILGNEVADKLACEADEEELNYFSLEDPQDLLPRIKRNALREWQLLWDLTSRTKGKMLHLIKPNVQFRQWYERQEFLPRHMITTICRLRIGHGLYPSHLFRMGLLDSPTCNCGEFGDVNHLLFRRLFEHQRINLFKDIHGLGLSLPINVTSILASESLAVYKAIYKYIWFLASCIYN